MMEGSFTVYFDPPYWVGIVEILENNTISVARHVFGVEPTEPQLLEFAKNDYRNLSFSKPVLCEIQNPQNVNFKRKMREIRRQMAERPDSTRSQDFIRQDYESRTRDRKQSAKEDRSADLEKKNRLKKIRRAEKHHGH
ncbi:MAG: YjdF family protein [Leptolinea sp.]|nr:YjdF family protein [Leptolinea sp.]